MVLSRSLYHQQRQDLSSAHGSTPYGRSKRISISKLRQSSVAFASILILSSNLAQSLAFQPTILPHPSLPFSKPSTIRTASTSTSTSTSTTTQLHEASGQSMPTFDELNHQKSEALRALSSFHDGSWSCADGALSFAITSDVTGGMTRKKRSVPYSVDFSTRLGLSGSGFKIAETFSWDNEKDSGETTSGTADADSGDESDTMAGNTVFVRACSLGSSFDLDSVDASFSLDGLCQSSDDTQTEISSSSSPSCALPPSISGIDPEKVSFVVEHVLVLDEHKRARCFLLYGKQDSGVRGEAALVRVVISYERKSQSLLMNNGPQETNLLIDTPENDRLALLNKSLGKFDEAGQDEQERILCPMSLMKLSLGPWLGDIIIRDKSFNYALPKSSSTPKRETSTKGFGKKKENPSASDPDKDGPNEGFAEWILGVQKAVITFKWDIGENVRQDLNLGKSLGCATSNRWPKSSKGIIYNDESMSRRLKPEERMLYIDYDMGVYGGFIVGSAYVKAPRFFKFNNLSRSKGTGFPMLTEFAVFQKVSEDTESNPTAVLDGSNDYDNSGQDVCSARITRIYGQDCKLEQGCTSFFNLKPVLDDVEV